MEEAELRYETYWILTTHICLYVIAQTVLTVIQFVEQYGQISLVNISTLKTDPSPKET